MSRIAEVGMRPELRHASRTPMSQDRCEFVKRHRAAESRADSVEISPEARRLGEAGAPSRSRMLPEKIARLRAEIAAGTYETDDKIDAVVERLLRHLGA